MKEANIGNLRANITLLGSLADAVGAPISKYQKKCLVPCIDHAKSKNSLARQCAITTMDKWAEAIGAPAVINHVG